MRENRKSGSEGGAAQTNAPSLPLSQITSRDCFELGYNSLSQVLSGQCHNQSENFVTFSMCFISGILCSDFHSLTPSSTY
jgi:hypothetical protein